MKKLKSVIDFLDSTILFIGKFFSFLIYVVMAIIVYELVSRWLFNSPTEWVHEASTMLYGIFFILGGGYALIKKEHVRMDIFYTQLTLRGKAIADIATFFLFVIYIAIIIWYGGKTAWHSLMINEHTQTVWGPPVYPSKIILVIGAILILIAGCTKFIRDFLIVATGKDEI
ncbi:MAG: TRAP transporter small permease subunit [Syntrophaceae bacterium]|nr:TRAP transporter small permease subunit [Syntrophaceae bacterium]